MTFHSKRGDKVIYMCLAGIRGDAWIRWARGDGTVDIGADVGSSELHELTRIEVVAETALRPGTCAYRELLL
jgi:hypothetical protein